MGWSLLCLPSPQRGQRAECIWPSPSLGLSPMDAAWPWCMLVAYDPGPGVSCPLFVHHDLSHKEAGPLPERKLSGGSRGLGHGRPCSALQAQSSWTGGCEGGACAHCTLERPSSTCEYPETSGGLCTLLCSFPQGSPPHGVAGDRQAQAPEPVQRA